MLQKRFPPGGAGGWVFGTGFRMFFLWLICCSYVAAIIEWLAGGHALVLPVFLVVAFYFTVLRGWRDVWLVLAVLGTVLDLAFGRSVPVTLMVLVPVQMLAGWWRRLGDCRHWEAQMFPGLGLGLMSGVGLLILLRIPGSDWGRGMTLDVIRVLGETVVGAALLLPLVCVVLDRGAKAMALPQYRKVRQ